MLMRPSRWTWWGRTWMLLVVGVLVLTACGGSGNGTAPAAPPELEDAEELVIGTISPLTGAGAAWGWAIFGGAEFAVDEINEEGGLTLDGTTYRLRVEGIDEEYTSSAALDAYTRLVEEEGVKILVGPLSSAGAVAVKDRIEQDKIITMVNSYTPAMLDENTHYAFRIVPTSQEIAPAMWQWIADNRGDSVSRLGIVGPTDETGKAGAQLSKDPAAEVGIETVAEEFYERGTQDFASVVTGVLASNPDVIDTVTSPPADTGLIMRQAREQGYTGLFIKTGGAALEDIIAVSGPDAAEGLLMNDNTDYSNPKVDEYIAAFEDRYDRPWNGMFAHFHDGVYMGLKALNEAGTLDPDAWVDAMLNITPFEGQLVGTIEWGGEETYGVQRQMVADMYLYEVKDGELSALGALPITSP